MKPVHKITEEIKKALSTNKVALSAWDTITPLAQNEWICWVTSAKKLETREKRLKRMVSDLKDGKRRPCCWPGCPHRNPNTKKWF